MKNFYYLNCLSQREHITYWAFYASFKYGEGELVRDRRLFNSYNEETLKSLIDMHKNLGLIRIWKTQDVRPGRENEYWVNVLCKKV